MTDPRTIEYKSDKLIAEGKYMQAVFESLKESGMLSIQRNRKAQQMIQGCVDTKDKKCPIADKCLRRDSANCAPPGVTLIVAPFEYVHAIHDNAVKCEYFEPKDKEFVKPPNS